MKVPGPQRVNYQINTLTLTDIICYIDFNTFKSFTVN